MICSGKAGAVAHQTACLRVLTIRIYGCHRMPERQCGELFGPTSEKYIGANHESFHPQLDQACKDRVEIPLGTRMQDMEPQPKSAGRLLQVSRQGLVKSAVGRIDE